MKEEIIDNETVESICKSIKVYFKENDISIEEAARRMGATRKAIYLQLSPRRFSQKTASRYAAAFGFDETYLTTGKGKLIFRGGSYRTIVRENGTLKAVVRALKIQNTELMAKNIELQRKIDELTERKTEHRHTTGCFCGN